MWDITWHCGFAAASWQYWEKWPLFQHMIKELPLVQYMGQTASVDNSYQYVLIA